MTYSDAHHPVPLIVRRVINRLGKPLGINPFPRAFEYNLQDSRANAFDTIYKENLWGSGESRSGVGSEITRTDHYRHRLASLLKQYNLQSLFDAPCGDLRWMPILLEQVQLSYEGGDISHALIEALKQQHPGYSLRQFDITRDPFPVADVWHCRDCLFHLPFKDIQLALHNFAHSSIPYALLTSHHAWLMHRNLDLNGVGFRYLDLERAPFHFPKPLAYVADFKWGLDFPRYVGLWRREDIAVVARRGFVAP